MDKPGSHSKPKESAMAWAIQTLDGCERARCCRVALDANMYFKSFTKCRDAKGHSDDKLKQHERLCLELVQKLHELQAAFSRDAQEKEACREKNVLLVSENVKLRSQLHKQQAVGVRLQATVQELADDLRDLQKQVDELHVRCAGFKEEVEGKEVEITKLRTSMEFKKLSAVDEQKNQQCDALDVSKSEAKPEAVVPQDVRGHALMASKRRSEERDDDGEITIIGTTKRSKSLETTPVTADAPLNSSNSVVIDQTQMPLLEQFWHVVKQNEQAMLCGWTNASALVDQFMLCNNTPCVEQPHDKQAKRAYLLPIAVAIFGHVQREKTLPPCPYKK